jgi:amino acid adenylation domain-containing protein
MNTINSISSDGSIPVVVGPQSSDKSYPASEAQLEVWLSSTQSTEANCAYNEISSLIFRGSLDAEVLKQAVGQVVQRHSALRSTFSRDGQQVNIHDSVECEFQVQDFSSQDTATREKSLLKVIESEARTAFDLVQGPLIRFVLQRISEREHKLTLTAHHLVMDGWSLSVFCKDFGHFYDQLSGRDCPALPPANHYHEYASTMVAHLESPEGKSDEGFWLNEFADQVPVLDLPVEKTRPSLRTYQAARFDHHIESELVERIRKVGAKSGCSLFNVMLAAFNAYVARISGNDDFCVGIPTAGQAALDRLELMGHCVNTMPLRTQLNLEDAFLDYMKASRKTLLDSLEHQCYSYGTLLRKLALPRDPARPPMLSVSFNLDPMIDTNEMGFEGLDVEILIEPRSFENFEWFVNGVILQDKSVELQVQYNTDLFSSTAMEFYLEGFEAFLKDIANDPSRRIADLHTMSVAQRQQVLVDWNDTKLDHPIQSTLHAEFSRQAAATPNAIAVQFEDTELTYEQVETESNQIARYLQTQGVQPGDLVGICVERTEQMLVSLYGIMKAGAGYVPLDPAYPSDRLQYMCDHSDLKLIVTQGSLSERVAAFGKPYLACDLAKSEIEKLDAQPLGNQTQPDDICYVIYTSGSTGKPKGVQVPHGCVVNFLYAMQQMPGFTERDSVLALTTLSFDIAVLELYLPTIFGGRVVIVDGVTAADGNKLQKAMVENGVSVMQATPATWRMLLQAGWNGKEGLKVLCGGEPMPKDLVGPLLERCDEFWNMYGPTETTVWSAAYQITNAHAPILIGKPIGNTQIYILDSNGNEVPAGCEGEIFIGGAGVTLGYRNQLKMTNERFVDNRYRNPFEDFVSDELYKTGDLGRYGMDGNLHFLRRNDKQVKVRGFRIELGEIEENLSSHSSVENCVVIVREDNPGDARLVAYVIPKPNQVASATVLRDHIRESLPYYMVPQHFTELAALPKTNNGKIDYKALPAPRAESVDVVDEDGALPETPTEKYLAGIWEDVLEIDDVRLNDTFFDIGGHSLLVMKVITAVHEKTGIKLSPQDFLISTLEQIADKFSDSYKLCDGFDEREAAANGNLAKADTKIELAKSKPEEVSQNSELGTENADEPAEEQGVFRKLKGFWS